MSALSARPTPQTGNHPFYWLSNFTAAIRFILYWALEASGMPLNAVR
jgi:hypothetical protein